MEFVEKVENRGFSFRFKHLADSIACVDAPQYRLNMIRPGALIYGMIGFHKGHLPVKQALTFRTAISQLHSIPAGEGVSYDYLWKAERDSIIATLPFGYADGYPRNMRDKGYVIIGGIRAPIVMASIAWISAWPTSPMCPAYARVWKPSSTATAGTNP